ncbi:MAG: PD-(D/E)XK nuclease family protein, partial [Bacteroidales bacterium]|nr:PD-(D/E)XK nuclease family protein [Bacteroidales bacterium]
KEPENKSSMLISKCVADFPGEELQDKERFEKINADGGCSYQVIPAAGEVEQTMIAAKLLKEIKMREMEKGWVPMETAIVVSDETLLLPLLSVIDETDINITMGYPVRATAVASLFNSLAALHLRARKTEDGLLLSGSVLREILSHPYVLSVDEADAKRASDKILKSNMIFVGAGQLLGEHPLETKGERMRELLELLVPPMETELASTVGGTEGMAGSNLTFEIVGYLRRILEYVSKFLTSRERCFVNGLHEVLDAIASSAIGSFGAEAADGSVAGEGRAGVAEGGAGAAAASAAGDAVAGDGGAVVEGGSGMAGAAAAGASGEAGAAAAEAFGKSRTVYSIIRSGLNGRNVAFRGEPLSGVQIMGPLETRCLDFKNIIFLSFNDGVFPASGERTSAIPYFLRKAFKLPTYEDKDSISSYNFYRLIQRAENVYMIYDTNTANIKTKEESRFIKQLVYDFGIKPVKRTFSTPVPTPKMSYTDDIILTEEEKARLRKYFIAEGSEEENEGFSKYTIAEEIEDNKERLSKDFVAEADVKKSEKKCLSPSSLNNYLDCNRRFFFEKILKLGKDEDLTDSVEASTYGSIYHCCMEQIYGQFLGKKGERKGKRIKVTKEFAEKRIAEYKDEEKMRTLIGDAFKDTMQVDLIEGENLVIRESVKKYIWITLEKDLEKAKKGEYWFEGAEYEINEPLFSSRGFIKIDRLENEKGIYRVCDYKSGRFLSKAPKNSYSELEDGDFPKILNEMFKEGVKRDKEYTILLQLFFYALMLSNEKSYSGDMELCVYQLQLLNKCGPIVIKVKRSHIEAFAERLKGLMDEIEAKCAADCVARMPICTDIAVCKYCDFKTICNREVKDE